MVNHVSKIQHIISENFEHLAKDGHTRVAKERTIMIVPAKERKKHLKQLVS